MPLKIRCARDHRVARRHVLTGVAALIAFPPAALASAGSRVSDLVGDDGMALPRARGLVGQVVRLRGYISQGAEFGKDYLLTESPNAPCQLCGLTHEAGTALRVQSAEAEISVSPMQVVEVTGRIERQGDSLRLIDAHIVTA
jgi:hypothetical protein